MARAHGVFPEMASRNRALGDGGAGQVHGPAWVRLEPLASGRDAAAPGCVLPWCAGSAWKKAAYAVAGYRWLSPASFSPTLIVCPRHYCVSGGLSPPAAPLPPPLTCRGGCFFLLLPLTPLGGQVVTDELLPYPLTPCFFRLRCRLVRGRIELLVMSVQVGRSARALRKPHSYR